MILSSAAVAVLCGAAAGALALSACSASTQHPPAGTAPPSESTVAAATVAGTAPAAPPVATPAGMATTALSPETTAPPTSATPSTATGSTANTRPASPLATPQPSGIDGDTQLASPFAVPLPGPASDSAAIAAAVTGMRAFERYTLTPAAWYAGLAPLLSPVASEAYQGTDPAQVPVRKITGRSRIAGPSGSVYLAKVAVPTNVGTYVVLLSRTGAGMPWLIERLTPPPGVGK